MSLRHAGAWPQGVDEEIVAAAAGGRTEELDPRRAAAVAVADAFLGAPGAVTAAEWEAITAELTDDEVAEIVLRLTQFSRNKVRVALGFDDDEIRIRYF